MSFLREMLSSDAKISSKRTVGFAAFFMLICSCGADSFSAFEVKDKILECFMYISVVGLGVTAAEKFGTDIIIDVEGDKIYTCLLYTSPSPRD